MFAVIRAAARSGQVDSPTLVTGETGTGKELLVRLIHAASGRAGGIVFVNCAALNDPALRFACVAKRRTGSGAAAGDHRLDELCAASDTTLFLDQVSELSSVAQARVLYSILRARTRSRGTQAARFGPARAWSQRPTGLWGRWSSAVISSAICTTGSPC